MGVVANLVVKVTASVKEFEKELAGIERSWSKTGSKLQTIGANLTKGITVPLVALGGGAAKAAIDFESSFAGVGKTVDGVMDKFGKLTPEGAKLAQGFRDLAKEMPVSVNELNKIGEAAGQLGIPKEHILEFTKTMAMMGATTNLSSEQAATSIAQIQNIFGAAGKDTQNLASTIVALGNAGASTEQDIVEMGLRIAGAGNQIGMSQAEVVGFASALANVGIKAEMGGSAISRVMSAMSVAVDQGGAKLDAFAKVAGMSASAFQTLFKQDSAEAITRFVEGLGRAKDSGANLTQVLIDLGFKNILTMDTMKRLAGAGDQLRGTLDLAKQAWADNSALTDEFRKRAETVASQLQILWNRVYDVAVTLGTAMLPTIKLVVAASDPLVKMLGELAKGFANLPVPVQAIVIGLGAIAAAAGPVIWAAGTLISSWGAVAGAMNMTGILGSVGTAFTALAAVMSGPVIAAAAIVAGIVALLAYTGTLDDALSGLWWVITEGVDLLHDLAVVIGAVVVDAFEVLWGWISKLAGFAWSGIVAAFTMVKDAIAALIPDWVKGAMDWFIGKFQKMLDMVREARKWLNDAADVAFVSAPNAPKAPNNLRPVMLPGAAEAFATPEKSKLSGFPGLPPGEESSKKAAKEAADYLKLTVANAEAHRKMMNEIGVLNQNAEAARMAKEAKEQADYLKLTEANAMAHRAMMNEIGVANQNAEAARMAAQAKEKSEWALMWETISASVSQNLSAMILGQQTFGVTMSNIWGTIKQTVLGHLSELLNTFINGFLKSITASILGQQGATTSAFGGMFSGFSSVLNGMGKMLGGWLSSAAKAIASVFSGGGGASFAGKAVGGVASSASGIGGAAGAAGLGGVTLATGLATAGIGAAAIGVYVGIKKWMGQKEQMATNDLQDAWFASQGGLEGVNQAAQMAGDSNLNSTKAIFASKTQEQFAAAVEQWEDLTSKGIGGGMPELATGGIVTAPTIAKIGEAGPEAVIPLSQMGLTGGGITVNVTVNASYPSEGSWLRSSVAKGVLDGIRQNKGGAFADFEQLVNEIA